MTEERPVFYVVIIAGGRGERFWPRSIRSMPKQFHTIVSDKTMIQETYGRITPEIAGENIFFVLGPSLKGLLMEQLPMVPESSIIVEPEGRNTAPAIGLATAHIHKRDPDAVIAVLSADHVIRPRDVFLDALGNAARIAEEGSVVLFGITPDRPATGFGYVELGEAVSGYEYAEAFRVRSFTEKPDLRRARVFLRKGSYVWNSGMFVFRADRMLEAINRHMHALSGGLERIKKSIGTEDEEKITSAEFSRVEAVSIDYGVMEKIDNIICVRPDFFWDDVGSWSALGRHLPADDGGNICSGNVVAIDSNRNIILGGGDALIALVGMEDTIVVREGDRILVCSRDRDQEVKEVLKKLSESSQNRKYL